MITHKMMIPIAYSWVMSRKGGGCGVAFKELNTCASNGEYPDVIGFAGWGNSVLVEVKSSRSDFLCDKRKSFRKNPEKGMGSYRFYMCPTGLIKKEDLPPNWGLIYVDFKGKATTVVNPYCVSLTGNVWSDGFEPNRKAETELLYSALRRLQIKGLVKQIYEK